jgi:hypothetical protein
MKNILFILAILCTSQLRAADYYWVGGSGNWSDLNHWRLGSSSGSIPSIVPSSGDNVIFDAGSGFTAGSKTVTLNANGFCNNMTWGNVANSPLFVTANAAFKVQASGNLSLSPATTYQVVIVFKGATAATLATNGTVTGQFGVEVDKPGGSLTVMDSLIVPSAVITAGTNGFTFTAGTFDITGKKMTVYSFISDNNNVRALQMANANLTVNSGTSSAYHYTGTGKTLNASGSSLVAFGYSADGGTYNKVTSTSGNGPNVIIINNTTFSALTFSPVPGGAFSDIGNGNNVDTLVYNGTGSVGANNTIGSVRFGLAGSLDGTGNVIRSITCLNNFQVSSNYTNTVDSMLLAPNHTTQFRGTFNINKYLYVAGAPCEAYTEIYGDSTAGTVNFASGAVVDISNVILTGVNATGPVTPVAVNGIDGSGNAGFTITEPATAGTTLYWVGGAGDWNDRAHWSTASGGAGGACIPFKSDDVVFDANSGLATRTVTTSSTSFCKDITWTSGVGTTTFNESAASSLRVYGSAVLQSSVTMNAQMEFSGSAAATLTTNGGGTNNFSLFVVKTGSGSLTLTDNWSSPVNGTITFYSGNLSMAGRTVSLSMFVSNYSTVRNLDISNATITANRRWIYWGSNKSISSAGSYITSHGLFQSNNPGANYPWVDLTEINAETANDFNINGVTFGQLTFTSTSATSNARILNSNIIRRLEYKGAGIIGSGGNNNIDSLILAGSRNYVLAGTNTIFKYFKAEAVTCSGLTEMRGGGGTATLAFQPAAEIHIANVYLQNIRATGAMTPVAFNGADAGGNTGWTITSAAGNPRYWVGGSGDWNDSNHWSLTSGGATGACIPTVSDDVYFDAGSGFTAGSKTVTVNTGNAYCRNLNWAGAANAPVWNKSATWNVEIWGDSIILNPAATFTGLVYAKGTNAAFLKGNVSGDFDLFIDKPGGSLTLLNDYQNSLYNLGVVNGALNASGRTLTLQGLDNTFAGSGNPFAIDISNSRITTGAWRFVGTIALHTLNATNSVITTGEFQANGMQYDTVNVTGNLATNVSMNSATINRLTFTNPGTASTVGITGNNNTLSRVEYKGSGTIAGTGNVMDTLIFFPGNTYTLNAGSNNTVNDAWYGSGTPCKATEIFSSSATVNATITKNGGNVDFDYVRLRRITAGGSAAPFIARSHSTDLGNNVNWNIAPYDGAAPIFGLGPDTAVAPGAFPIVLHTDGFFGAPSSQYLWNNNSTADSLVVAGPGTYTVSVSFPDGCSISDQIVVTLAVVVPVNLISFTGTQVDCRTRLNWKVADAVNFSGFTVEKSKDAYTYSKVADLPYTGVAGYTWIDSGTDNQTSYYRLKMVDADGQYAYSNVISAKNNCREQAINVYPTLTDNQVQVFLPAGYEHATIQVYNIQGQQMSPLITGTGSGRTVRLQDFPKATYVLQVINGSERKSFTVIKH